MLSRRDCIPGSVLRVAWLSLALLSLFLDPARVAAADRNPFAGDPKAAKAGEFEFRINCAFCHGLGARGGGRGPDLTRAQKRHGSSDAELFQNINNGIPGTVMPANVRWRNFRFCPSRAHPTNRLSPNSPLFRVHGIVEQHRQLDAAVSKLGKILLGWIRGIEIGSRIVRRKQDQRVQES